MRWNLRQMFVVTFWIGVLLALLTPPIRGLVGSVSNEGWAYHFFDAFLNAFRHVGWMLGYDVDYRNLDDNNPIDVMGIMLGGLISFVLHLAAVDFAWHLWCVSWNWANEPLELPKASDPEQEKASGGPAIQAHSTREVQI